MSIRGTNTLSWDYFDEREITSFAYVPAIRRIRQTSGAARSDPYMGSDGWLDLNYQWAGKNRSMKWKLVGERTILAPLTSTAKTVVEEAPDGTISRKIPPMKFVFNTPGSKGAPWGPTSFTYIPRPVWVIEQMPIDPYYNWGLHINYVDKETGVVWWKEIYDKAGQFRTWTWFVSDYSEAPSGNNTVGIVMSYVQIDERVRHASIHTRLPHPEFSRVFLPGSKLGPDFFSLSNFLQLSK